MNAKQLFNSMDDSQRQKLADNLVRVNIIACQSALVDNLIENQVDGFTYDDIENIYYTDREGAAYYLAYECDIDEVDDYINQTHKHVCKSKQYVELFVNSCDDDYLLEICNHFKFDELEKQHEIYEWWLVSDWFAEKLRGIGQPVLANDFGTWWGRTCTGQSISCDYNIQMLACEVEAELQNKISKVREVGL